MAVSLDSPTGTDGAVGSRTAQVVLVASGLVLASGVLAHTVGATQARIGVGVGCTAVLVALAGAAPRLPRLSPARDGLLALAALSVFGWASAAILAVPVVAAWSAGAPVVVAFLVVNAMKLTSVLPLLVLAWRRKWSWRSLGVRMGDPAARSFVPGLRWPVLAVLTVLVVEILFATVPPGIDTARLHLVVAWLPVMLVGALVNALSEELLYRHALIGTTRAVLGATVAVLWSSLVFGLGHLTGTPGGLTGVAFTFGYGLVCALALLQTRGAVWNVAIHVCGDLAAVSTLFLAAG